MNRIGWQEKTYFLWVKWGKKKNILSWKYAKFSLFQYYYGSFFISSLNILNTNTMHRKTTTIFTIENNNEKTNEQKHKKKKTFWKMCTLLPTNFPKYIFVSCRLYLTKLLWNRMVKDLWYFMIKIKYNSLKSDFSKRIVRFF